METGVETGMWSAMSFEGLKLFAIYLGLSLVMLGVFVRLYIWTTPYHEPTEIAKGKMAPAIALAGAMLGFTFPLLVASFTRSSVVGFLAWGALACFVQLLLFQLLYRLMPRSIEANNVASATCYAAASVCVGLINAASFLP
jgi:putative membrane protein